MRMRLAPIALIAVACTGGLTACGATPGTPAADGSASNGTSAQSPDASGVLGILGVTSNPSAPATSGSKKTPHSHESTPAGTSATSSPSTHPATPAPPPQSANPTSSSGSGSSGGSGTVNFTVPSISGDNVVSAYGSYTKLNAERVKVTVCAKQTGTAYSVGALALAYNTSGQSKNVGAVVLLGPGNTSCGTITFLFYSAHLTVHAFIGGNNGVIAKTGPSLSLY